ncbi:hypothetical protein CGZ69_01610 [Streptomyces peucetius subsp. caesius ATCC 27952]|nr:hypothetical protein CGZ69_01610 [Streptomyces peucetius subsp. caesius ATCC 27952]
MAGTFCPYDGSYRQAPGPAPAPRPLAVRDCRIGHLHLETLPWYDVFAGDAMERIRAAPSERQQVASSPGRDRLTAVSAGSVVPSRRAAGATTIMHFPRPPHGVPGGRTARGR